MHHVDNMIEQYRTRALARRATLKMVFWTLVIGDLITSAAIVIWIGRSMAGL